MTQIVSGPAPKNGSTSSDPAAITTRVLHHEHERGVEGPDE
jgi:hypothetical protein